MNSQVTLKDVAKAVGLSETTVSLVINGKAAQRGITPATQARVSAAIRQLGYQPDPITRRFALHQAVPHAAAQPDGISNGRSQIAAKDPIAQQIGLVLSVTTQTNTLALIPGLEQDLTAAGYHLNIIVTPADPTSVRARISQLLHEDPAGILACPSVYAVVTTAVATACPELSRRVCPVIVLWQDAAKAMLRAVSSGQLPGGSENNESKAIFSEPIWPSSPAAPAPASSSQPSNQFRQDGSAGTPRPTQIQEIFQGRAKPPAEPMIFQQAAKPVISIVVPAPPPSKPPPIIVETRPQAPTITPDPTPIETPQSQEPAAVIPEPVTAETPPVTPASTPETTATESSTPAPEPITDFEPFSSPEPVIEEAPTPEPAIEVTSPTSLPMEEVAEIPTHEPEPVSVPVIMPEPVVNPPIEEIQSPETPLDPIPMSQPDTPEAPPTAPPPEPVIVEESPTPEPVVATPIPEPEPTPTPVSEPPPVTPASEPAVVDEPPPTPKPIFTETPVATPIPTPDPPPIIAPDPVAAPPIVKIPPPEPPHPEPIPVVPTPPPVVIEEPAPIGNPNPVTMEEGGESIPDTEEIATEADVPTPAMTDSQDKTDGI
ncbi:MAG: LacI family DNA-binding transcriptional regulator [bacterium]|jgi:hypothetical protein